MMLSRAVFLDRDGTICEEVGHLEQEDELTLIEGSSRGIALLNEAGFKVIIVTNQSVIARGRITELKLWQIHLVLSEMLAADDARFDAIYYCPHHPKEGTGKYLQSCECRKPRPGMFLQASRELEIDLHRSFIVGDKLSDLEAGRAAGCREILVRTGYGDQSEKMLDGLASYPDCIADNLLDASRWILEQE
jgi:D-glycero-D-manno-heptose 1,7-bisphosphate phosphatase